MEKRILTVDSPDKVDPKFIAELEQEMVHQLDQAVVGYDDMKRLAVQCLFTNRNQLLVSVPGLGKTVTIMALGEIIGGATAVTRQFVSDLMPSDIIGSQIINEETGKYDFEYGPLLGNATANAAGDMVSLVNIFGADEINRANPKMQSALLGAMQEGRVMIGKTVFYMPRLFTVVATRNPIENEGTYDLPEAQLDRFAVETLMTYLPRQDELKLNMTPASRLRDLHKQAGQATDVFTVLAVQKWIHDNIYLSKKMHEYILDLVLTTRPGSDEWTKYLQANNQSAADAIAWGCSPRASQAFIALGQARAAAAGRNYVLPKDVRPLAGDVIGHRLIRTPMAMAQKVSVRGIVEEIVKNVPVVEDDKFYNPKLEG